MVSLKQKSCQSFISIREKSYSSKGGESNVKNGLVVLSLIIKMTIHTKTPVSFTDNTTDNRKRGKPL